MNEENYEDTSTAHEKLAVLNRFNTGRKRRLGVWVEVYVTDAVVIKHRIFRRRTPDTLFGGYKTRLILKDDKLFVKATSRDPGRGKILLIPAHYDGVVPGLIRAGRLYFSRRWRFIE